MCNVVTQELEPATRTEANREMSRRPRITAFLAALLISSLGLTAGAAAAPTGGAGIAPPQNPRGFDTMAKAYSSFPRTLRPGQTGQDVKTLQTYLTELGIPVPQTGYFGSMTQGGVKRFQRLKRLRPVTGTAGRKTLSTEIDDDGPIVADIVASFR